MAERILARVLQEDLRTCALGCLPAGIKTGAKLFLTGPLLLQVDEFFNVGACADERDNDIAGRRVLKYALNDGKQLCAGLEVQYIPDISVLSHAGLKIQVKHVEIRHGLMLLSPHNVIVLGGKVQHLDDIRTALRHAKSGANKPNLREAAPDQSAGSAAAAQQPPVGSAIASGPGRPAAPTINAPATVAQQQHHQLNLGTPAAASAASSAVPHSSAAAAWPSSAATIGAATDPKSAHSHQSAVARQLIPPRSQAQLSSALSAATSAATTTTGASAAAAAGGAIIDLDSDDDNGDRGADAAQAEAHQQGYRISNDDDPDDIGDIDIEAMQAMEGLGNDGDEEEELTQPAVAAASSTAAAALPMTSRPGPVAAAAAASSSSFSSSSANIAGTKLPTAAAPPRPPAVAASSSTGVPPVLVAGTTAPLPGPPQPSFSGAKRGRDEDNGEAIGVDDDDEVAEDRGAGAGHVSSSSSSSSTARALPSDSFILTLAHLQLLLSSTASDSTSSRQYRIRCYIGHVNGFSYANNTFCLGLFLTGRSYGIALAQQRQAEEVIDEKAIDGSRGVWAATSSALVQSMMGEFTPSLVGDIMGKRIADHQKRRKALKGVLADMECTLNDTARAASDAGGAEDADGAWGSVLTVVIGGGVVTAEGRPQVTVVGIESNQT